MSATAVFVVIQAGIAAVSVATTWATWPARRRSGPSRPSAVVSLGMVAWYAVNFVFALFGLLWWQRMSVVGTVLYAIPVLGMGAWSIDYALVSRSARRSR